MYVWIVLKANKQNTQRKEPQEVASFLKLYTDICGPFDVNSFNKEKYFITFTDDFSRYEHVYLLYEKSQTVNALEIYINEVKRQLDKKVKVVRSNRGGK